MRNIGVMRYEGEKHGKGNGVEIKWRHYMVAFKNRKETEASSKAIRTVLTSQCAFESQSITRPSRIFIVLSRTASADGLLDDEVLAPSAGSSFIVVKSEIGQSSIKCIYLLILYVGNQAMDDN